MAGVQGIGGVFLDSKDPAALAAWYDDHLGVGFIGDPSEGSFYRVFLTRDHETGEEHQNPVFSISRAPGPLAAPDERGFVVNLRVDDIAAVLDHLATIGVLPEGEVIEWEGGKHVRIRDLDGNRLELYQEIPLAPDSPIRT